MGDIGVWSLTLNGSGNQLPNARWLRNVSSSSPIVLGMGIRYFASAIRPTDVDTARSDPRCFQCKRYDDDDWDPTEPVDRGLDLDKSWWELQLLFESRPAHMLVEGRVTQSSNGWIPHYGVLDPEQVRQVAEDLATIDEDVLVRAGVRGYDGVIARGSSDFNYVMQYLNAAKEFTALLARDGLGLIYTIG